MPMNTRVLLCDNDLESRVTIATTLQKNYFTVEVLPHLIENMDRIKIFDPDIILMDYLLRDYKREEAVKILSSDKETAHIPIVFMSTSKDIIPYASQYNKLYLQKPFDIDQFKAILNMYAIK